MDERRPASVGAFSGELRYPERVMHQLTGQPALKRAITRTGYSAMTLNGVIGAGIFGLPAVAAAMTGAFSPWLFVIGGLLALTIVLSFSRAASMFRRTGGMIVYAGQAFGPFVGFQTGWLGYIGRVTALAANSNLLITYASWLWEPLGTRPYRTIAISLLITALTWLNVSGVRNSIGVIYVFTLLKLLPLSLLIFFGLGHLDLQVLSAASFPETGTLGEAVLVVLYAYVGFEGTVVNAGEGRRPRRDLPWAMINTILATGLIYVLVQAVAVSTLPGLANSKTALVDVAAVLAGTTGAAVMTLGAVFSIGGNVASTFLTAPRMTFALAHQGSLPAAFGAVHPRYESPHVSLWCYGAIGIALAVSGTFVWLAVMSTLARLLTYIICIAALPRLEKANQPVAGQFRLPGGFLVPGIAMVLCLWLISHASARAWLTTLALMSVGTVLYAVAGKRPVRKPA